jgi:putative NADH-flavin reductase
VKLALLGATGAVGREVLNQAVVAGHAVTAVVRNPAKLPTHVDVAQQDFANPNNEVLAAALRDVDAVISAVGPNRASQAGIVAPATAAIAHAMDGAGVRRLVVISAAPVGVVPSTHRPHPPRYDPGDDLLMRYLLSPLIRRIFGRHYIDLAAMEDLLRDGSLDWTTIRLPRLTDGPLTGTYRTAIDRNVRHGLTISRPDVAHLMLTVLRQPETVRHSVGVAYWVGARESRQRKLRGRVEIGDLRSAQRVKAPRRRCPQNPKGANHGIHQVRPVHFPRRRDRGA